MQQLLQLGDDVSLADKDEEKEETSETKEDE